MSRRHPIFLAAGLLAAVSLYAASPAIHDISVSVRLYPDGSALVREVWDVTATEGTEWYLVRHNLGDIEIRDFSVSDETGTPYTPTARWDVDLSLAEKRGRCGILPSGSGVELCWGLGSYGRHTYRPSYIMDRAVKSLDDADMLHLQLVSPGLSSRPEHVAVSIEAEGVQLDTANTSAWGFGFTGATSFRDGRIIFESTEKFSRGSSVIALLRFDKGIFTPQSVQERSFAEVLDTAMEGSDFPDGDDDGFAGFLAGLLALSAFFAGAGFIAIRLDKKKILGMKPKEIGYWREIPFGADLVVSRYTLERLSEAGAGSSLASAMILDMIGKGAIIAGRTAADKVELRFAEHIPEGLDERSKDLLSMMRLAAGADNILQDKEFSSWSRSNVKTVNAWLMKNSAAARGRLRSKGMLKGTRFTPSGQEEARRLYGLRKFIKDFTLIDERDIRETSLWHGYLVYGALFGLADTVLRRLKDIDPTFFDEETFWNYHTLHHVLMMSDRLGKAITDASIQAMSSGAAGHGGSTSFGGGRGFSGGGFGGGAR